MELNGHKFREFEYMEMAQLSDYPPEEDVPKVYNYPNPFNKIASCLFFNGGELEDYGLIVNDNVNKATLCLTIAALLSSFDPQHEHRFSVVAWLLDKYTHMER